MTPQERKVIELALEALESGVKTTADRISWTEYDCELMEQAITAIEEALAQPEQAPVAWGLPGSDGFIFDVISPEEHTREEGGYTVPLYTTPPQPKEPEQEPVIFLKEWSDWRDMVVVNIMRHGSIDKHLARELANHFQSMTPQPKEQEQELFAVWLEKECDEQYLADRVRAGDYVKEKGCTENRAALADNCLDHLPPSLVGVGENDYTAQPEQEPIAYFNPQVKGGFYWAKPTKITAPITVSVEPMPLYTAPPQRKPLTREQIVKCQEEASDEWCGVEELFVLYARAIEAAHNIKE